MEEPLCPQELRVLRFMAAGRSNPEITEELTVSVNTIKTNENTDMTERSVFSGSTPQVIIRSGGDVSVKGGDSDRAER